MDGWMEVRVGLRRRALARWLDHVGNLNQRSTGTSSRLDMGHHQQHCGRGGGAIRSKRRAPCRLVRTFLGTYKNNPRPRVVPPENISYLLVGLVLGSLLDGDRLLGTPLLQQRLRDDGFRVDAHLGRHGCKVLCAFDELKRESDRHRPKPHTADLVP